VPAGRHPRGVHSGAQSVSVLFASGERAGTHHVHGEDTGGPSTSGFSRSMVLSHTISTILHDQKLVGTFSGTKVTSRLTYNTVL
jgi:hypothetical protein